MTFATAISPKLLAIRSLFLGCILAVGACTTDPQTPSPNDTRSHVRGEAGTPASTSQIGTGTGLGPGTNSPSETTSAPALKTQPIASQVER